MPLDRVKEMASMRGDGHPYHWRVPQAIWPTIVLNMKYIAEGEAVREWRRGGGRVEEVDG